MVNTFIKLGTDIVVGSKVVVNMKVVDLLMIIDISEEQGLYVYDKHLGWKEIDQKNTFYNDFEVEKLEFYNGDWDIYLKGE